MILDRMHPEDVKAAIRKRYGSVARFIAIHRLPETSVSDLFRGRKSSRVSKAVEKVLLENANSIKLDSSGPLSETHRLNGGVK